MPLTVMEQPYYMPRAETSFLRLQRPIVFFDLETTGTDTATDRVVELCAVRVNPDGSREERHHLFHPTIPIPQEAIDVHGFTDAMVAGQPTFAERAGELALFFEGCDLGGFNIRRFDVPLLMAEFDRCGWYPIQPSEVKIVDTMAIYHRREKRDLSAAVRFYLQREHEGAHSALADVEATIEVLKQQLLRYADLEPDTDFLHDYTRNGDTVDFSGKFVRDEKGVIVFNFGKHKGREAALEPDYLEWMMGGDFPFDTKLVARHIHAQCTRASG